MGKEKNPRRVADNEALAKARMLRTSPQKLNLVAGLIRGKKVDKAMADLIFSKKRNTLALCIYSFLSVLVIYGGIMNISSVLTYTTDINLQTITAYIVSGIPFDLIHAVSTVIFVLITGDALLKKCCRLRVKFGLFQ